MLKEQSYQSWQEDFNKLEDDFDLFLDYFNKNKTCKCDINECEHFDQALVKVLGKRTNDIFQSRLNLGINTYYQTR